MLLTVYWVFFVSGVLLALVTVLLGDLLQFDQLPYLEPMSVVGGATIFGGTGILLTNYSSFTAGAVIIFSLVIAVTLSLAMYFLYVKKMKNAETSIAFSIHDLTGRVGEVSIPIPAAGYGEILLRVGAGLTHQIAASFDSEDLPAGTKIVVVDVKDGVLLASRMDEDII